MKEHLMLGALGVFVWLLRHYMGPPVKRQPGEAHRAGPHPERDVPMADTPVILDTGSYDGL